MQCRSVARFILCLEIILLSQSASMAEDGYVPHSPRDCPFEFVNMSNMNIVMSCPAHAHGTLQEAEEKLKQLVALQPEGRASSVWVCRANQLETLKMIGPLADNMLLNVMAITSKVSPDPNELLWPGFDHPFINHIRQLRKIPNTHNLYAVIDNTSDFTSHFVNRNPSFEEIKWMTFATIGCDFQGILWRGRDFTNKVHDLEKQILAYKDELGRSVPVDWVTDNKKIPVSARATEFNLFVTMLNPDYFRISEYLEQVSLPVSLEPEVGQLEILLPDGYSVIKGKTFSGINLNLQSDNDRIQIDYSFWGSGDMMVFQLGGDRK